MAGQAICKLCLLAGVLLLGAFGVQGKKVVIGDDEGWTLGVEYSDLYLSPGDTMVYAYSTDFHDVWMQRAPGCDLDNNLLADLNVNAKSPLAVRVTAEMTGTYYISCSVGSHCVDGMYFAIHILPEECATECETKCATPTCGGEPTAQCVRTSCKTCDHIYIVDGVEAECAEEDATTDVTQEDATTDVTQEEAATQEDAPIIEAAAPVVHEVVVPADALPPAVAADTVEITVQHNGKRKPHTGAKSHSGSKYPGYCEEPMLVDAAAQIYTVHCVSPSVAMNPGQVINTNLLFESPFPADRTVAIVKQSAQLVHAADLKPVPADEVYMHHFVTMDTLIVPPPTGQGSIWRAAFPEPYSLIVPAGHLVPPAKRYVNLHLINTIGVEDKMSCVECRCPKVPLAKISEASKVPAGGVICCKDCKTNAQTGPIDYALQYDSVYRVMEPESSLKPVRLARLDGALGAGERIEYEIPYNPSGQQNVVKYNLTLNDLVPGEEMTDDVEIIRCDGHQHMGGQCLELYDMTTKTLICNSCPRIGTEEHVIGNEKGYVVAMSQYEISPPRKLSPNANLQMVARYDATERHTGVMSIFFLYYSQGPKTISALTAIDVQKQNSLSEQASETFEDFVGQFPSVIDHATQNCQEQIWQFWTNCPLDSANAKSEENAVVCCSMMGALAASKCTCTTAGYAEPDLLMFLMNWEGSCTTAQAWDMYALACHGSATWAWNNIFAFVGSDVVVRPLFEDVQRCLMAFMLNWGNALWALLTYYLVNALMSSISPSYNRLNDGERFQCCVHCVFMFTFALQFMPYAYVMAKLLFGPDFQETAAGWEYLVLMCAVFNHSYLYIIEGGFRACVKKNYMLLVHHLIFFLLPPITQYFGSVMAFKVVYTIDLFATFEFALYSALVLRRLGAPVEWTKKAISVGIWIYGVSRFIQFSILVGFFIGSFAKIGDTAVYWVLTVMTTILMFIQLYTFVIYRGIYVGLDDWAIESAAGKEVQHDWINIEACRPRRGKFGIQLTERSDEDQSEEDEPLTKGTP